MQKSVLDDIFYQTDETEIIPPGYVSFFWDIEDHVSAMKLARGYALAGLHAFRIARANLDCPELFYPAFYLIRHATELYIKGLVPDWRENKKQNPKKKRGNDHGLLSAIEALRRRIGIENSDEEISKLSMIISTLDRLDPNSTALRYKDRPDGKERIGFDPATHSQFCFDPEKLYPAVCWMFRLLGREWERMELRRSIISSMQIEAALLDFDFSDLERELRLDDDRTGREDR